MRHRHRVSSLRASALSRASSRAPLAACQRPLPLTAASAVLAVLGCGRFNYRAPDSGRVDASRDSRPDAPGFDVRLDGEGRVEAGPLDALDAHLVGLETGTDTPVDPSHDARVEAGRDVEDAPVDIGRDAPGDAGRDARLDAGNDATSPERRCDCVDDDLDGMIDDGCAHAGTVAWETIIDLPGTDAFRGVTRGGDGLLYLNGWFGRDPFSLSEVGTLCGGTFDSGRGLLLWLDPAEGRCLGAVQNDAHFGSPHRAPSGVWLFQEDSLQIRTRGAIGATHAMLPGADFLAGQVLAPEGTGLIAYRATATSVRIDSRTTSATVGGTVVGFRDSAGAIGWLRAYSREALVTPFGADRWASVGRSTFGMCAAPAAPHLEIRSTASPDSCSSVVPLALDIGEADESAIASDGGTVWFATRTGPAAAPAGSVQLVAVSGGVVSSPLVLGDVGPERSPLVFLEPYRGGVLIASTTSGDGLHPELGAAGVREGYLAHVVLEGGPLTVRWVRPLGGSVIGFSLVDSRAYLTTIGGEPRSCTRSRVPPPENAAAFVTALELP